MICVALTATATPHVVDDIISSLKMKQPIARFSASCFRSNLFYEVKMRDLVDNVYKDFINFAYTSFGVSLKSDVSTVDWVSIIDKKILLSICV